VRPRSWTMPGCRPAGQPYLDAIQRQLPLEQVQEPLPAAAVRIPPPAPAPPCSYCRPASTPTSVRPRSWTMPGCRPAGQPYLDAIQRQLPLEQVQ
ncbi:hypothetical protein, partial [Aquitalea magnusonii]|uniref:hypothetical protein n=1 Tax=Aquitalea magnusonii TaxID=332411 RepID=UPI00195C6769